ncbi:hypothetical protein CS0771_25430 [Catellatospora sp. IY07-71]|uniref:hypothetical protein n=1 Tax=Catellatospora sp. IY07-71 TaxID=2728827 RepID=UPI001BB42D0D|nr:hypothetical protein [Catellatospora sp. IY07-71]BCJ72999.1 hypothetical protein CS0771_25430 [Catellatospora sp. IY07-71]
MSAAEPVVIELGTGWREPLPEPEPRRQRPVRLAVLGLAAALSAALGGAAPDTVPRELGRIALTTTTDSFQILGGQLVVQDGGRLSGHGLTGGAPIWSVPVPPAAGGANLLSPAPGTVLVSLQDATTGRPYTALVDTARGEPAWQAEALPVAAGWTGDVVVLQDGDGAGGFVVREVRTGRVRWSGQGLFTLDPDRATAGGPLSLWTLSGGRTLTEHDVRDGRVLRSRAVDLAGADPRHMLALGGELLIEYGVDEKARELRLDLGSLAPVAPGRLMARRLDCGAHWCVVSQDPTRADGLPMDVVDKATGAVRHRVEADAVVEIGRWGLLTGGTGPGPRGLPLSTLIETATGRVLADLSGWELLLDQPRPVEVLVRGRSAGPVQFARLTPTGLEVVAELPGRVGRCAFAQRVLACSVGDGLTLWRWDA